MVYRIKKFFNIAFQGKDIFMPVFADFVGYLFEGFNSFMGSFANTAGKRVRDERRFKYRIQDVEYGMMQYPSRTVAL